MSGMETIQSLLQGSYSDVKDPSHYGQFICKKKFDLKKNNSQNPPGLSQPIGYLNPMPSKQGISISQKGHEIQLVMLLVVWKKYVWFPWVEIQFQNQTNRDLMVLTFHSIVLEVKYGPNPLKQGSFGFCGIVSAYKIIQYKVCNHNLSIFPEIFKFIFIS